MPACCICWKSSIIFSYCPALTYLVSLLVHEKLCNCMMPGAILASSGSTHAGFCWLSSQSAACVVLCLKSGYFAFPYHQKSKMKADLFSHCIVSHDMHNKSWKAILTSSNHQQKTWWQWQSINQLARFPHSFTYLLKPVIPPLWRIWEELLPKFLSLVACTQPARRKVTNCWKIIQTFPHCHDVETFFFFPWAEPIRCLNVHKQSDDFLCTKHNATKRYLFSSACLHSNWSAVPAAIGGSSPLQEEEAMDLCHRPEPESHAVETVEIFFFRRENRFTHRSIDYNRTSLHCRGQRKRQKFRERNSLHRTPKRRAFSRTILFRVAMPWPNRELGRWNEDRRLKSGRDLFF